MPIPSQTAAAADKAVNQSLLTPEEIAQHRRRRRLWLAGLTVVLLAAVTFLVGKPVLHAAKAWQARRKVMEARQFLLAGNLTEAGNRLVDANQLWRSDPEVVLATASFLTRMGKNSEAVTYWTKLEETRPLTAAEQVEFATAELGLGDVSAAEARLHGAWPTGQPGTLPDWILGAEVALRRQRLEEGIRLAKLVLASPEASEHQHLSAAQVILASPQLADQQAAWTELRRIAAGGRSVESLEALLMMARRAARSSADAGAADPVPDLSQATLPGIIAKIQAHPQAKVQHQLLALDLQMLLDPSQREALLEAGIERYKKGDTLDLGALGSWLYGKGEFARLLEVIPLERAQVNRVLFLQHLDTLGALGRWQDIQELISGQHFSLEPIVQEMYLARCAERLNQPESRDVHWKAAVTAAGTNVQSLLQVGQYAEKNGATDTAEAAFYAAVKASPKSREAAELLVHLLESEGKTRLLRETLWKMAATWPQDPAIRNDAVYLDALLSEDLNAAHASAEALMRADPASLPHRTTLAMTALRLGDGFGAMDAFAGVGALSDSTPARTRAVYAVALWKTSYDKEARQMVATISPEALLPEERELIAPIQAEGKP